MCKNRRFSKFFFFFFIAVELIFANTLPCAKREKLILKNRDAFLHVKFRRGIQKCKFVMRYACCLSKTLLSFLFCIDETDWRLDIRKLLKNFWEKKNPKNSTIRPYIDFNRGVKNRAVPFGIRRQTARGTGAVKLRLRNSYKVLLQQSGKKRGKLRIDRGKPVSLQPAVIGILPTLWETRNSRWTGYVWNKPIRFPGNFIQPNLSSRTINAEWEDASFCTSWEIYSHLVSRGDDKNVPLYTFKIK